MSSFATSKKLLAFGLAALAALAITPGAFADNVTTDSDQSDVTATVGAEIAITATDPGAMTLSHLMQPATSIGHVDIVSTQPDWTVSIKDTDTESAGNLDRTAGTGPSVLDQAFEFAPDLQNSAAVTGSNQEVFSSSANDGLDVGFSQELTAGEDVIAGDTYASTVEYSVAANLGGPVFGAYDQAVLANSPWTYWRLGSDGGTDSSGNGHSLFMEGDTFANRETGALAGGSEGATLLDADANIYSSDTTGAQSAWTLETWVKVSDNTQSGLRFLYGLSGNSGANVIGLSQLGTANGPSYTNRLLINLNNTVSTGQYIITNQTLTPGTTYHIVWTNPASGSGKLYLNGSEVNLGSPANSSLLFTNGSLTSFPSSVPNVSIPSGYTLGLQGLTSGWRPVETIDNLAFYTSELSSSDVSAHYAARNN